MYIYIYIYIYIHAGCRLIWYIYTYIYAYIYIYIYTVSLAQRLEVYPLATVSQALMPVLPYALGGKEGWIALKSCLETRHDVAIRWRGRASMGDQMTAPPRWRARATMLLSFLYTLRQWMSVGQ